jgi:hypothetical protein
MNIIIIIVFLLVFAYVYSMQIVPRIRALDNFHKVCNIFLPGIDFSWLRGEKYYRDNTTIEDRLRLRECIATNWNVLHFCLFFVIGVLCPNVKFLLTIFLLSVIFELYEYHAYKCHDVTDCLYNAAGLGMAYIFKRALS